MLSPAKPIRPPLAAEQAQTLQKSLLTWYAANARALPWRATTAPYPIWLAEIMLQQTTVTAVIPYYTRFLEHFPTLQSLAEAPLEEVLHLWQGLGYYRRAHLLHRCAQQLWHTHKGQWPTTPQALRSLPGFGPYTAGAVASCAFNTPALAIDGNVVRVLSRLLAFPHIATPATPTLTACAQQLAHNAPPRAFTNALMELGSQICTPKTPACARCPWQTLCAAYAQGTPQNYPVKPAKPQRPHKHGVAYVLRDTQGHLWLNQRPPQGLLGGLWEPFHTGWEPHAPTLPPHLAAMEECGSITHVFTHFTLMLEVRTATVGRIPKGHSFAPHALPPLPSLFKKTLRCAGVVVG